jgi:hypothetical protein
MDGSPGLLDDRQNQRALSRSKRALISRARPVRACFAPRPLHQEPGREPINSEVLADVRLGMLYALKSDITPCPNSAAANTETGPLDCWPKERVNDLTGRPERLIRPPKSAAARALNRSSGHELDP